MEIALEEIPTGTRVVMSEEAKSPAIARWGNPVLAPLIHVRNVEALRRLAALCNGSSDCSRPSEGGNDSETGLPMDSTDEAGLDEELADSCPASDHPSSWGGIT